MRVERILGLNLHTKWRGNVTAVDSNLNIQPVKSGALTDYVDPRAALGRVAALAQLALKDNAFRHSYITYRVAETNDTARVALECGNSPEIIFQHYRELVGPDDAAGWFGAFPSMISAVGTDEIEVLDAA